MKLNYRSIIFYFVTSYCPLVFAKSPDSQLKTFEDAKQFILKLEKQRLESRQLIGNGILVLNRVDHSEHVPKLKAFVEEFADAFKEKRWSDIKGYFHSKAVCGGFGKEAVPVDCLQYVNRIDDRLRQNFLSDLAHGGCFFNRMKKDDRHSLNRFAMSFLKYGGVAFSAPFPRACFDEDLDIGGYVYSIPFRAKVKGNDSSWRKLPAYTLIQGEVSAGTDLYSYASMKGGKDAFKLDTSKVSSEEMNKAKVGLFNFTFTLEAGTWKVNKIN